MAPRDIRHRPAARVRDHRTTTSATHRPRRVRNPKNALPDRDAVNQALAEKMAPILMLHPKEKSFPMNPRHFIAKSRFRMHLKLKRDKGYNKKTGKWHTTNSKNREKYINIPVNIINQYGVDAKGRNRRPRDKNNGSSQKVFLQPMGSLRGDNRPTGRVPAYYYIRREGARSGNRPRTLITYWYFFGDNPTPALAHQGDWEHATLSVRKDNTLEGIWFSRHGIRPKFVWRKDLEFLRGRALVYISKASHGNWPKAGTFRFEKAPNLISKALKAAGFADVTSRNGVRWDISKRLEPLYTQPWRDYAGAWGEVGELPETTGPLGPWHKRHGK